MSRFFATVDGSGDIVGLRIGDAATGEPDERELTAAQFRQVRAGGLRRAGDSKQRWRVAGSSAPFTVSQNADTRRYLRFSTGGTLAAGGTEVGDVDLTVGDPQLTLTYQLLDTDGTTILTPTLAKPRFAEIDYITENGRSSRRVRFTLTSGIGTIVVPTTQFLVAAIVDNDQFRVTTPVSISVAATTL